MPLDYSGTKKARQYNVEELISSGRRPDVAVAASYSIQRRGKPKKRRRVVL